jgi:jumonji domain-containing protein 1C
MNSQAAVPKQNTHQQQQRNIRPSKRKGSDSSIPDEEKMKEEKYDYISRGGRLLLPAPHLFKGMRTNETNTSKICLFYIEPKK